MTRRPCDLVRIGFHRVASSMPLLIVRETAMARAILFTLSALHLCTPSAARADTQSFFKQHCVKCHGPDKQKAKLRLDTLAWKPSDTKNIELWQEIIDRVDSGEMPPKGEPKLAEATRKAILSRLRRRLADAATSSSRKQVVLRRLNRAQYRNTIRDLLHIDITVNDPTEAFPADDKLEGFDNLGEALQMSDFLLRQYLKVARRVVDQATFPKEQPTPVTYRLKQQGKTRAKNFSIQANDSNRDYVVLTRNDERAPGDPRGQSLINSREGAPQAGYYDFTFEVESKGRGKLAEKFSPQRRNDYPVYRPEDLHRMEIYITAPSRASNVQTRPRTLVYAADLPDNKRVVIKKRLWLPKAWRVELGFGNGYWGVVDPILLVDPQFDLAAFRELPKREQNSRYGKLLLDRFEKLDAPRINIYSGTESGPHYDQWPPASHQTVWGRQGQTNQQIIRQFATRAFRRPVTDAQIAPYVRLAEKSSEGIRTAIEAILCSPRFLYLHKATDELDDYAIASRLSYFLWNTMPDQALLRDAANGKLRNSNTLIAHVDRMLADPRSDEFVNSFVWAWLHLDNTVEMAPDPMKFYDYHRNRIAEAMVRETNAFFRHLLDQNLPISNFIDADFAIINANLGRLYGLTGKVNTITAFQKVSLTGSIHRGGLLGQASVLTASANGVDTSPVVRGIWILEHLLGTPPAPPPPDVDIPEPDARGKLTIRELYAKHRTVASCNECHRKIDPLGFALENFDAIGRWRTKYESGHDVDPSGQMPGGEKFEDVSGLKRILLHDLDQFSRNLTSKLMTYATGRRMAVSDRPEIDSIVQRLTSKRAGLRDLVKHVVSSNAFQSP